MQKFIAYRRVSTKKQGVSGLGLEGQDAAIATLTKEGQILKTYTEVESGKRKDRPELAKAIAHARLTKSVLVIAKLDRLSRNVAFLSTLMESELEFVACDNPHADKFTVHILAAVAEKEARDISARTKAALNAYKARGGVLGRPENLDTAAQAKGRQIGTAANQKQASEAYAELLPMMQELRTNGATLQAIADKLNTDGYTTRRGKKFSSQQVLNLLNRS